MKYIIFFLVVLAISASCADSNFSAGSEFLDEQVSNVIVDTTTVNLNTVLDDSTATSGIDKIFMGRYESSDFGNTTAKSYFSFSIPTYSSADFSKSTKYGVKLDSVCLILTYDSYSYGDTTQTQTLNVYKLTDRLDEQYTAHNSAFYSNQSVEAETTPYVTKIFTRPSYKNATEGFTDSTLSIRLPDAFAEELMDSLTAQSTITTSTTDFLDYFKGFMIAPSSTDKYCVNAFKMTSTSMPVIRVYYHSYDGVPTEKTIEMSANTTYAFSNITQDRSSTNLKNLTDDTDVSSNDTGHKAYLQGMVGLKTQMTFPYIYDLLESGKYTNVAAAYIYIYPAKDTYNDFTPLPKNVTLNFVNKLGEVKDIYTTTTTTSISAGVLTEDPSLTNRYYYAFDVTTFIQSEITALENNKGTLQLDLSSTDKANTLKSLIIGDSSYPETDYRIKLVIQLLVYNYD